MRYKYILFKVILKDRFYFSEQGSVEHWSKYLEIRRSSKKM